MYLKKQDIVEMNRVRRLNLINGITGIKSGNLIGTRSPKHGSNVGIFSSVIHLGSDPALLGFILRPNSDVIRDTYNNILETGYYTINHIHQSFIENAHYTSAKFDSSVSEFDECGLTEEYLNDFPAPFVGESQLKMGLHFLDEYFIKQNGTRMIVGEITDLHIPEETIDDKGYVRLDRVFDIGIGGLNSYYSIKRIRTFPYARVHEVPNFKDQANEEGKFTR